MDKYVMIGFAKIVEEQGEWSAKTALHIIDGTSTEDIPLVTNKKGKLMNINLRIAEKSGVPIPYEVVDIAHKIIE